MSGTWPGDRQQIVDVVARYCRSIDRRDFALLRTCYHPDATEHHTGFSGSVDEYVDWLRLALSRYAGTHHMLGQQLVDIDGDVARCESYGTATHWVGSNSDPKWDYTTGFRYVDRMERRDGHWRIAERIAVRDFSRSDAGRFRAKEGAGPSGSAAADDPLYHLPGWPPAARAEKGSR
ncbi:nuclear transport factor 2 family protein [Amycolatopsis rhizosphaerae]|uniref:Nuclear transport factor 2 family protein n=1 Tax=Amycolatopsis rhizosphaerae TaxID=2053003 RepID=A0A558DJY5_9PSEU|nr:nuclear transport factor 2 family protein [Amycolatopsis rhizosphaerae]TVT61332.1 nuclear transport factor 2 family protein [Amycolatopsis rhizosphaerae]